MLISCVCLWPKAVVHGYILVGMCIKKDESMKAETDLEMNFGGACIPHLGRKAVILLSDFTRLKKRAAWRRSERWPRLCRVIIHWVKLGILFYRATLRLEDI